MTIKIRKLRSDFILPSFYTNSKLNQYLTHIMKLFDIDKVYNAYISLDRKQRKDLIKQLNSLGIPVTRIEAYTYSEAPGIRHLFFYLKGNSNPISYFLLEKEQLEKIQEQLLVYDERD